jgi:hypothetical protein
MEAVVELEEGAGRRASRTPQSVGLGFVLAAAAVLAKTSPI